MVFFFLASSHVRHDDVNFYNDSISAQVIMRGNRSAGYGFVALSTAEAAQKAVEVLDKKQLDNRPIIVEIAKPADQKENERRDRKPRGRRTGRRGSRAVPGEVTDAEANGEAKTEEDAAPTEGEALKPKKKKKKSVVGFVCIVIFCRIRRSSQSVLD
jgi:RNA recognition motif-containing protein